MNVYNTKKRPKQVLAHFVLSAGQSAGNILQPSSSLVSAKRALEEILQLAVTAKIKCWHRKEQRPPLAKGSISLPL
jgi:hypothetical protein